MRRQFASHHSLESALAARPARALALAAVLALAAALAGCAAFHFEQPRVELVEVALENVGLVQSSLALTVRVENPNGFALPIERGDYTLFLAGDQVGSGSLREPIEVPAHAVREETIVIDLDNARFLSRLRDALSGGNVDYRIEADHYVDLVGFRDRPFHSVVQGQVDLRGRLHM